MLDIDKIRADFPILSEKIYGKPLIYLDNAATTQKPQRVLDKIVEVYATQNANIHRGVHYLSQKATLAHEEARKTIAQFIGAADPNDIVFTHLHHRKHQSAGDSLHRAVLHARRRNHHHADGAPR